MKPTEEYTAEQWSVVSRSVTDRVLVTAGAGTGKTHLLIGRLAFLIDKHGLSPGGELLVLTFSRAAVGEIRRRLRASGGWLRFVTVSTFDSYASSMLAAIDLGGKWTALDYEGRIRAANEAIRHDPSAAAFVRRTQHLLVDEVQDLVGDRVGLVDTLLSVLEGGFTLLGDPSQGIYGFRDAVSVEGSPIFTLVRQRFGGSLIEQSLTTNFRAQSEDAKRPLEVGPLLSGESPNYAELQAELRAIVDGPPHTSDAKGLAPLARGWKGRAAVLCRTNGEALVVSRELREAGLPNDLQRAATDRAVVGWVARCLWDSDSLTMSQVEFERRASGLVLTGASDPDDAYTQLHRLCPRAPRGSLDPAAIAERIRLRVIPDELVAPQTKSVIVSTIHRAKGLEFDEVMVVWPWERDETLQGDIELAEETRLLYVALTRARSLMGVLGPPAMRARDYGRGRRVVRSPRGGGKRRWWTVSDFEFLPDDLDAESPPGSREATGHVRSLQEYLWSQVKPGDKIDLRRLGQATGAPENLFAAVHQGQDVSLTSEYLASTMHRCLQVNAGWVVNRPVHIEGLVVEGIETVAGSSAAATNAGIGAAGIWLRPRISGLGSLKFEPGQD